MLGIYHEHQIKGLVSRNPDVNPNIVRWDYFSRLYGGADVVGVGLSNGERPLNYAADLVNIVDDRLSQRINRILIAVGDYLFP